MTARDIETFVLGAQAQRTEAQSHADAVERAAAGLARRRATDGLVRAPVQRAQLAVEIDRAEGKDGEGGAVEAVELVFQALPR